MTHKQILHQFRSFGRRPSVLSHIMHELEIRGNYMKSLTSDHSHRLYLHDRFGIESDLANRALVIEICKHYCITRTGDKKYLLEVLNTYIRFPEKRHTLRKGASCSISGSRYEENTSSILKDTTLNGHPFHTQSFENLGGSSSAIDICCNHIQIEDIGIEIKKHGTPDWMQCRIIFSPDTNSWIPTPRSKRPQVCTKIFNDLLAGNVLYGGGVPPFENRNYTKQEWKSIKASTSQWNDIVIDIPCDTIRNLYSAKGCHYIQVSKYGLYHLGHDVCDFGVPMFVCDQVIRIRTKVHKSNNKGHINLSVTAACKPRNIRSLVPSPYSLDAVARLPPKLIYCSRT